MEMFDDPARWLPFTFAALMGVSILVYVILDGFDLGVGVLFPFATDAEKDTMVASIGPFWDANETWLVLAVGLLLVAFPVAHVVILSTLYLPVFVMLIGLILRGVAFDFRVKAHAQHKESWNLAFFAGSLLAATSQGYMLGRVVTGFEITLATTLFSLFIGLCLAAGYALLGATWLIIKTEGALQLKAVAQARLALVLTALGIGAVSFMTPALNERIFDKWFQLENLLMVWPIPVVTFAVLFICWRSLGRLPVRLADGNDYGDWVPFACAAGLYLLAFQGLRLVSLARARRDHDLGRGQCA